MKRQWFEYDDGTFYRNCSLIMDERKRAMGHGRWRLAAQLSREWNETFRRGVQYKEKLGRHDKPVGKCRQSFRTIFPGLVGRIPEDELDRMDALPSLPGDPKYHWQWV